MTWTKKQILTVCHQATKSSHYFFFKDSKYLIVIRLDVIVLSLSGFRFSHKFWNKAGGIMTQTKQQHESAASVLDLCWKVPSLFAHNQRHQSVVFPATPFHRTPAVRDSLLYNCRGKRLAEGQLLCLSLPLGHCIGKISETLKKKKSQCLKTFGRH